MKISEIHVENRYRKDLGDVDGLAESMRTTGLLQPVVIRPDNLLIAGERRLAAATKLGWEEIDVTIIEGFEQAADLLRAERDENTCRKPMTPSETVALAKAIEAIEQPKAVERKAEGGRKAAPGRPNEKDEPTSAHVSRGPQTRDIVADAVGMGRTNLGYAKKIVEQADAGDPHAIEARRMMDETGQVMPAYEHMIGHRVSHTERTPSPKAPPRFGTRRKHRQVIEALTTALAGWQIAVAEINELDESVTAEEAARFTSDLSKAVRAIGRLNSLLKERSSDEQSTDEPQSSVAG